VNAEPIDTARRKGNIADSQWFAAMANALSVWSYIETDVEHVRPLGVPFHYVPFGYAATYESRFERYNRERPIEDDIDVMFFGNLSARRSRVLDELESRGLRVYVASAAEPAYGAKLNHLLARSKIVLGIHQFEERESQIIDLGRLDYLMSNRIFVLHERPRASTTAPALEQHVTTCEYEDFPERCGYFLARPEERRRRAAETYEWFKTEYALESFIPYDDVRGLLRRCGRGSVS
jgi:hypothetical protein